MPLPTLDEWRARFANIKDDPRYQRGSLPMNIACPVCEQGLFHRSILRQPQPLGSDVEWQLVCLVCGWAGWV